MCAICQWNKDPGPRWTLTHRVFFFSSFPFMAIMPAQTFLYRQTYVTSDKRAAACTDYMLADLITLGKMHVLKLIKLLNSFLRMILQTDKEPE